jgi:hypothetical protein
MSRAVFDGLRAKWRRGRANKNIRFGEDVTFEFNTATVGPVILVVRFEGDSETLVLTFLEIYAKDVMGPTGPYRAKAGLAEVRRFLDWIAGMAADLGYTRLRVRGQRTRTRRKKLQLFEFDLANYRRGLRGSR